MKERVMAKIPKKGVSLRGTSGLPDNITGYVDAVTFGTDSQYAQGKELVAIIEMVDEDGNPVTTGGDGQGHTNNTIFASVGKGWDDADKGRKMVRADGSEPGGINDQTMFQTIINRALDTDAGEVIEARFEEGVMPFHAELLEDLGFLWKREEYTPLRWDDKSDEEKARGKPSRLLPSEFIGVRGDGGAKHGDSGGGKKAKKAKKDKGPATDD